MTPSRHTRCHATVVAPKLPVATQQVGCRNTKGYTLYCSVSQTCYQANLPTQICVGACLRHATRQLTNPNLGTDLGSGSLLNIPCWDCRALLAGIWRRMQLLFECSQMRVWSCCSLRLAPRLLCCLVSMALRGAKLHTKQCLHQTSVISAAGKLALVAAV